MCPELFVLLAQRQREHVGDAAPEAADDRAALLAENAALRQLLQEARADAAAARAAAGGGFGRGFGRGRGYAGRA